MVCFFGFFEYRSKFVPPYFESHANHSNAGDYTLQDHAACAWIEIGIDWSGNARCKREYKKA